VAPWALGKVQNVRSIQLTDGTTETADINQIQVQRCVFYSAEAVRIVGILLQPYMPEKAARLLDMLGVEENRRTFDDAELGADVTYGAQKVAVGRCASDALFPPLVMEN